MNRETESTQTKITHSGPKALVQGIFRINGSHVARTNSRDVEHAHEPPRLAPADAAFESGVIR